MKGFGAEPIEAYHERIRQARELLSSDKREGTKRIGESLSTIYSFYGNHAANQAILDCGLIEHGWSTVQNPL